MLNGTAAPQILAKALYREIHTYKGVLNQFSFPTTPTVLHDIETGLSGLLLLGDTLTRQKIAELVASEILQPVFDKDLAILTDALGKEFLANRKEIILSDAQAQQLEKLAKQLLRGETIDTSVALTLLNQIRTLRELPIGDVLMSFSGIVKQVAERMEKDVAPLEVTGGADVWINPKHYQAFFRSLVHVFRNAVAHGLETPDGRWEAKKDEAGKITCSVAVEGDTIKLVIADDGAGINLDALRERAVATGIYGAGEVQNVPDEEIARLIFMDNISTQKEVTELAGRGVGLAAVLNETKNLGGEVLVKTVAGGGTQFLFNLPWLQESLHNEVRS
jgi:two-component system chemotaxis sensor kinase CheA